MDNVLVDFLSGIERLNERDKIKYEGTYERRPGILDLMPPMPGAIESYLELADLFDAYILSTSPWKNPSATMHKFELLYELSCLYELPFVSTNCRLSL